MRISSNIVAMLNTQTGHEFSAMLQYVAIAAHFEKEALPGLAAFFQAQSNEEHGHALRFVRYLGDIGAALDIPALPAPQCCFASAESAVLLSLEQEIQVGQQINALVHQAKAEADFTTDNFLQYFVQEQLEEISTMEQLLSVVRRAGEDNLLLVEEVLARNPRKPEGA
ncbi:MAG TPA: ferritin [Verrucomicrobiales bacterium]|nr:ferritin [Verrucomicrobiales bacterium]